MKPTNAKGIARLFLKSLFEELGESEKSMKPMEYSALATRIGLTNSEMQSAISQLKRDLLIRFDPESTQIIRLTTKGIQEGSSLRFRNEHPEISDPLPDSLDGVDAEINYFAQLVAECLPGSNDWEWITERLKNLRYRHSTMLKQSEPSTVYHQQITQH